MDMVSPPSPRGVVWVDGEERESLRLMGRVRVSLRCFFIEPERVPVCSGGNTVQVSWCL